MDTETVFPCIAHFSETGEGLREAQSEMAQLLYKNPRMYGLRDEDEVGDLFARYPGRIEAILRRYSEARGYFPAYLTATVRYLALSLRRDRARAYDRQLVFDQDALFCSEPGPDTKYSLRDPCSPLPEAKGRGRYRQHSLRSRFVFLSLKCAWTVDEDTLAREAAALGVDEKDLSRCLCQARESTRALRERWENRKTARDASWVRLRVLERRLLREEDPASRELYRERIARERARFHRRLSETRKARLTLSNKAVAEILGVPKGTVDAGLFHAARRLRDFQPGIENR